MSQSLFNIKEVVLASQSPRRRQLLEWAGVSFEILVKETDESYPEGITAQEVAIHIAKNKALAVRDAIPIDKVILAADTIVVLGERIIGKPAHRDEAIEILTALAGQTHQVITGVVIIYKEKQVAFADVTTVEFHELAPQDIAFYVDTYKPYDKAGAYAIQEWIGVAGIKAISGDFYNVMGLPISRVVRELLQIKAAT